MDHRHRPRLRASTFAVAVSVLMMLLQQQGRPSAVLFVAGQPVEAIDFSAGFSCDNDANDGLDLNMNGRAYPRLVPTTSDPTVCQLRLSPDQVGRAVSAFVPFRFTGPMPVETTYAFSTEFTYQISGITNGIGDGLAFVMHQSPSGDDALGMAGGSLGVYGGDIAPALVVEFDTYKNRFGLPADTADLAIHVTIIDAMGAIFEVAEIPAPDIRNTVNNMTPIQVEIDLDGDTLSLSLNQVERLRATVNLDAYFVGRDVIVGFTGGTGAVADQQDILTWTLDAMEVKPMRVPNPLRIAEVRPPIPPTYAPVPTPPVIAPSLPVVAPSAAPSAGPSTYSEFTDSFWAIFIRIVRATLEVLRDTQNALATRNNNMGPNDRRR